MWNGYKCEIDKINQKVVVKAAKDKKPKNRKYSTGNNWMFAFWQYTKPFVSQR